MKRRELFEALAGIGISGGLLAGADGGWNQPVALQTGDVRPGRAVVWVRGAQSGEWTVRWRVGRGAGQTFRAGVLTEAGDFTGRVELTGLPESALVQYEVDLPAVGRLHGSFRTAPGPGRDVRFLWSGDMVGQGWGIPVSSGIHIFDAMRQLEPDFFLHSGDTIYADGPVPPEVKLPDGRVWKNVVTEEKSRIAQTLDEFRGCYRYNLLDQHVREFSASVAQIWQWDDHELTNNWSPSKDLREDGRYREKDLRRLLGFARQAFLEYAPLRSGRPDRDRIYRHIPYGLLLDVFVLDMRSYRGPNTYNRQTVESAETAFLGRPQFAWLLDGLRRSRAVWKVIAADMPLGLIVGDGQDKEGRPQFENAANSDGPPLGRELEIARLLAAMKRHGVRNSVWLTADVHYTAAHYYDPAKAQFPDFDPFWEFVSGPLHAGTFGPAQIDNTFGPQVLFAKAPPAGQANLSPLDGMQFFGDVRINAKTREMQVTLRDLTGAGLYSKTLSPEPA